MTAQWSPHVRDIAEIEEALGRLSTGWRQLVDEGSSSHEEARRRKAPRVRGTRILFAEARGKRPSRAIGRSRRESVTSGRDSAPTSALHARRTTRLRDVRCPGQSGRGKAFDASNRAERGRAERRKPHGECNSAPDPKPPGCAPRKGGILGSSTLETRSRAQEAEVTADPRSCWRIVSIAEVDERRLA
jgi:hypothetical protein